MNETKSEAPICFTPIGTIHTPFKEPRGVPIQPVAAEGIRGRIEIRPEYGAGLQDLDGFSHIILLYHLHLSEGYELTVVPFLDETPRGLFATRAPRRPNAIGFSVVRLESIEGATLRILDVDIVDGTPLLDIKPHVPTFSRAGERQIGWLEGRDQDAAGRRADARFLDRGE